MSLIIILFAIFSFVNSNCWTQFNEECLSFTYENKSYSASQCVWNNHYEDGWCATKLDEDSAEVEEYGVCEKKDESFYLSVEGRSIIKLCSGTNHTENCV